MSETDPEQEHGRSLRRAAKLTAGAGAAHALLLLLAYLILASVPGADATDEEILAHYGSVSRRVTLVGLYMVPFAGIAFLWFISALRMWTSGMTRRENVLLANMQLVSGILYIALFFAGAAASSVLAASVEFASGPIDPVVARQFPQYGNALIFVFAIRMAAVFVFTTSNIGLTTRVLPRSFVYSGYAVGLFMLLSATFSPALVLLFPFWMLALSVILLMRAREIPGDVAAASIDISHTGILDEEA
jgi:hypothetical protein